MATEIYTIGDGFPPGCLVYFEWELDELAGCKYKQTFMRLDVYRHQHVLGVF